MPDSPKWTPGPYTFEHVDYFITLPGLEGGTFEISNQELSDNWLGQAQTLEQARLFAMAPNLYTALEENARFLREIMRARWVDPNTTDMLLRIEVQETLCARARGEKPNTEATPIERLNLNTRALHRLQKAGIRTIQELRAKTDAEILQIPGIWRETFNHIKEALK